MDRIAVLLKQYRYVILVLLVGIGLMLIPGREDTEEPQTTVEETPLKDTTEEKLAQILSKIEGVGKTEVLLTIAAGEETVYESDEDQSTGQDTGSYHREVIIITDSERNEAGLIQQVIPPVYQGAIVVCEGADSAAVRLAIVEAVSNVTGLTADKITVLKMK